MDNNNITKSDVKKAVWSEALLDSFSPEIKETHTPGDIMEEESKDGSGIRYYATNGGGWSGNIAKIRF